MCRGLTLIHSAPRRPARYGRVQGLQHHPFVPAGDRVGEEGPGLLRVGGDDAGGEPVCRHDRRQAALPLAGRGVDQVGAVQVQQVEQERRERGLGALPADVGLARGAGGGDLERPRPPVRGERHRLAVQDHGVDRQGQGGLGDLRHPCGDVIQRAGEHGDVLAGPVHLDPDAVDLPLRRGRADPVQGGGDVRRRGGEHGPDRPAHDQREAAQRGQRLGAAQRRLRHRGQRPAQLVRAPDLLRGHRRGLGHRVGHHALERALAEVTGQQPDQELAFAHRGPAEELGQQRCAAPPGSPARSPGRSPRTPRRCRTG